jgi:hypothetical protein
MRWIPMMLLLPTLLVAFAVTAGDYSSAWLAPNVAASARTTRQDTALEAFRGVTADGTVKTGLFPIIASGVTTAPVRQAAERFLAALDEGQRARTTFPVDHVEWRLWNNIHRYARQGVSFDEMSREQRERAFALLRAGLSARGFETSRDIMRLNGYLAELISNFEEYGEYLYWLTVMGEPSGTEPWGWQLDGHHLVINYFVLGDQVVRRNKTRGSH